MDALERREARFKKINRALVIVYCALGLALGIFFTLRRDGYHLGTSFGTLGIPLALALFYRLAHIRPARQMDFWILIYSLLAFTLGTCLEFYSLVPHYDKLMHALSGVLVSALCIALFLILRPGRKLSREDLPLAVIFTFFGSMAVAGLWEMGEYAVSILTGRDVQNVLSTGVQDSMQDMIMCFIGTLLTLPALPRLLKGRLGPVSAAAQAAANHFPQKG